MRHPPREKQLCSTGSCVRRENPRSSTYASVNLTFEHKARSILVVSNFERVSTHFLVTVLEIASRVNLLSSEGKLGDRRDVPYSTPNHITEAWESPDHPPKKVFRMRRTLEYLAGHTAQQKSLQGVCTLVRWNGELPPQIARLTCGPPATFMNQRM
jgi:hypothetical protein